MFLNVPDLGVPDFLSALGFVAPKGYDIDYFLMPEDTGEATLNDIEDAGFVREEDPIGFKMTNVTYQRKDPKAAHSFSTPAPSIPSADAEFPRHNPSSIIGERAEVEGNPVTVKQNVRAINVQENKSSTQATYLLKESVCGLPKNTLIVYTRMD